MIKIAQRKLGVWCDVTFNAKAPGIHEFCDVFVCFCFFNER